jgi:hypothetical protein
MASTNYATVATTQQLMSLEAFHVSFSHVLNTTLLANTLAQAVLWTLSALCIVAFAARLYVRFHCFQRLLVDDWIMMFALVLLLSIAVIGQVFLVDVYKIVDLENGKVMPDATFPDTMRNGLRGFGAALTIALVGILAVKINFLLFFKRLGTQITTYLIFWYVVLFITIACGATNLGLMDYKCVFGSFEYISMSCTQRPVLKRYFDFQIVSVVLDVFSDLFSKSFTPLPIILFR